LSIFRVLNQIEFLVRSQLEYGRKLNEWGILDFVLKDGAKLKKNKLKGDTNIILGGQKYNFGRKNLFFWYI